MKQSWEYGILEDAVNKGSSNISLKKIKGDDGVYPVFGAKGFVQNVSFYQQENEYFKRMRTISDQLLFELCQKLLQILNFSGFMLKHLLVGDHLQPRVDVLIREQDAYEVIQERRQHQRPSHTELREHTWSC